ncbi:hypothetical protein QJS04_geneDACA007174 [Acorus gramineus]|uniref:Uncharacterized protein n=1 Tax=Acorus gramineus TaxID=55184 RepID=A0AAV9BLH1_ACOGR|nr:hypothetical protein QJS04_geneDACA007174 [Acorus gramineus]
MSGGGGGGGYRQLDDESDFEALLSSDGSLSVCGFGSLLSGRRVLCHAAPIFFERGIANEETREFSSLSVEPCEGESLLVTVFEIAKKEIPSFIERENEFRFLVVVPESLDGTPFTTEAGAKKSIINVMVVIISIKSGVMIFCLAVFIFVIAKNLGQAAYDNFLDHTFISDRKTTIREYLATTGSGIMEEEPPEHLRSRYGGY